MKRGRPTKFKDEMCEQLVQHLASGLSFESFAAVVHVNRDTLYEWASVHGNFSDAKKAGESSALLFWEKVGRAGVTGKIKGFNVAAWIFTMKNRFKWRDRLEHELAENATVSIAELVRTATTEEK